jgi:DNA-directed RNA polymerase subunit RPC12/RpoP
MAGFVTLTCPSCGGKLQVTQDIERFACSYCGSEHVVKRSGGIVSLVPVVEGLKKVQSGVDRTASELAIRRLRDDITALEMARDKGGASGCFMGIGISLLILAGVTAMSTSTEGGIRLAETMAILGILVVLGASVSAAKRRKPFDVAIAHKKEELSKHEQMVSR